MRAIKDLGALATITAVAAGLLFVLLVNFIIVYFTWNWIVPDLFGLPSITFVQAFLLTFLCNCLFKGTFTCNHKSR